MLKRNVFLILEIFEIVHFCDVVRDRTCVRCRKLGNNTRTSSSIKDEKCLVHLSEYQLNFHDGSWYTCNTTMMS
jgi:hypothetical protein